jgi:hypothetical protein
MRVQVTKNCDLTLCYGTAKLLMIRGQMIIVRTLFAIILAVSLAALPARVGAMSISVGADMASAGMVDCESMHNIASTSDDMPMADESGQLGQHKNTQSGACFTFCNSIPLPPTIAAAVAELVLAETIAPTAAIALDGIGLSPEPHPPKLA